MAAYLKDLPLPRVKEEMDENAEIITHANHTLSIQGHEIKGQGCVIKHENTFSIEGYEHQLLMTPFAESLPCKAEVKDLLHKADARSYPSMSAPWAPWPPTVVQRVKVQGDYTYSSLPFGDGKFANVYAGHDSTGATVAGKVFKQPLPTGWEHQVLTLRKIGKHVSTLQEKGINMITFS